MNVDQNQAAQAALMVSLVQATNASKMILPVLQLELLAMSKSAVQQKMEDHVQTVIIK